MRLLLIILISFCVVLGGCSNILSEDEETDAESGTASEMLIETNETQMDTSQTNTEFVTEIITEVTTETTEQTSETTIEAIEDVVDKHYLTVDDIIKCPLYRPDLTEEMAIAEGINLIESVSGRVYSNDDVKYTFYDWSPNPIAMTIQTRSELYSIMDIQVGDSFDTALSHVPIDYNWRTNSENLIYGKVPNYALPGDYHFGRAYVDEKGVGLITFIPTETYPFVQFRIVDNKVAEIVVYYYGL